MDQSVRKLRLLHLDLKTVYSYGDQLLFEAVRHVFNGFGGGVYFDLTSTAPFRQEFTTSMIDNINQQFDAVVIGGGGLFPRRTNASPASGWQWNISLPLLRRLEVPLIVFAVGNAPSFEPGRSNPTFTEHIRQVVDQSVFFGARSSGAVDSIRSHLSPEQHDRVTLQPCPTTLARHLFPDIVGDVRERGKVLGLQVGLEQSHVNDGLTPEVMYPRLVRLVGELRREGWDIEFVGHKRSDMGFHRVHGEELSLVPLRLYGKPELLFEGLRAYARYPVVLGARGHSQMIPFGIGAIPLSLATNDKIRFFAQEAGHPEWLIDPWRSDMVERCVEAVSQAWGSREQLANEIDVVGHRLLDTTLENMAAIYWRITGSNVSGEIASYSERERRLALAAYCDGYAHRQVVEQLDLATTELRSLQAAREQCDSESLANRARSAARRGDVASARNFQVAAEVVGGSENYATRPRWARGLGGRIPAVLLGPAIKVRLAARRRKARRSG